MDDNAAQRHSPSYRLPVHDLDYLLRDELRGLRFALEYGKADLALRDWRVRSTIVVFGSARIPSPERAEAMRAAARTADEKALAELRAGQVHWYEQARNFARLVSVRGGALGIGFDGMRDNVIATGGGPGIMEAANRGAAEVGAPSIGFNIRLPTEEEPNSWSTPSLTFRFHYFAMRKMHLVMRANALVVFPGGFGTFDELFELLTLQQSHKAPRMPVILFGRKYWREVVNFEALAAHGMIARGDLELFDMVDEVDEGWAAMLERGLIAHTPPAAAPKAGPKPVAVDAEP